MTTELEIFNQALSHLGQFPLSTLEDTGDVRCIAYNTHYTQTLKFVLGDTKPPFAKKIQVLNRLSDVEVPGYAAVFQDPGDMILPRSIRFKVDGEKGIPVLNWIQTRCADISSSVIAVGWQSDDIDVEDVDTEVVFEYIALVEETSMYDSYFIDALALRLAANCAILITSKLENRQLFMGEYVQSAAIARTQYALMVDEERPVYEGVTDDR